MFSKSKRFPEVGKDYIPGPGEYQVNADDSNRHKRYGFLNQTNRFQEEQQHIFDPNEFYESSTTTSTTSKASDDNRSITKRPLSQLDSIVTMQKEIDTLQAKTKKMSAVIQSLELEKSDTKAILLSKDLELAEQRSKNATLQKTIQRQEVSSKASQLQKKIEQLESTIESLTTSHQQTLASKDQTIQEHINTISHMAQTQQELKSIEARLSAQLAASETHAKQQEAQLKHEIECITSQLETHKDLLTASQKELELKSQHIDTLSNQVNDQQRALQDAESLITHLHRRFDTYRQWIDGTVVPHLRQQRKEAQQHQVTELHRVQHELIEAKKFINRQAQHIAGLKSDVHWLTIQNEQVSMVVAAMGEENKEQCVWIKSWYGDDGTTAVLPTTSKSPHRKNSYMLNKRPQPQRRPLIQRQKHIVEQLAVGGDDDDSSDTFSFSSRSSLSNDDETIDPSLIALNDSGFGILTEELK